MSLSRVRGEGWGWGWKQDVGDEGTKNMKSRGYSRVLRAGYLPVNDVHDDVDSRDLESVSGVESCILCFMIPWTCEFSNLLRLCRPGDGTG